MTATVTTIQTLAADVVQAFSRKANIRFQPDFSSRILAPVTQWVRRRMDHDPHLVVGLCGAQGSGKSVLAALICELVERVSGELALALSLDDFYLTKKERRALAETVHPLCATRGVPGSHDLELAASTLDGLLGKASGDSVALPRFDKLKDDRANADSWPRITPPARLVVLEGWCVGARAQPDSAWQGPVNALEREHDPHGKWWRWSNTALAQIYPALWSRLDALIFIEVDGFEQVLQMRTQQEQTLLTNCGSEHSPDQKALGEFIQHFERLTRQLLEDLPGKADLVIHCDAERNYRLEHSG